MFMGRYEHAIDEKGRLTIPSRYREIVAAEGAFITQGFDRNLMVLSTSTFDVLQERINKLSLTDPSARMLKRLFFSNAEQVEVDRAGRILIPQFLREIIDLDGNAAIIGVGNYFEIWSQKNWAEHNALLHDVDATNQLFSELDLSVQI